MPKSPEDPYYSSKETEFPEGTLFHEPDNEEPEQPEVSDGYPEGTLFNEFRSRLSRHAEEPESERGYEVDPGRDLAELLRIRGEIKRQEALIKNERALTKYAVNRRRSFNGQEAASRGHLEDLKLIFIERSGLFAQRHPEFYQGLKADFSHEDERDLQPHHIASRVYTDENLRKELYREYPIKK